MRVYPLLCLVCSTGCATVALADVTIEERIDVNAIGGFSFAAMEGTSVTRITGDKARTDSDLQFKSKLLRTFGGKGGATAQIIRLDEHKIYDLDLAEKSYTELSFDEMRQVNERVLQQYEQASEQQEAASGGAGGALPVDDDSCEWSEPRSEVGKSGRTASIAGLQAEEAVASVTRTCTDRESGKACDITFRIEQWLVAEPPGGAEVIAFYKTFAERMGYGGGSAQATQARYQQLFSQYQNVYQDVAAQAQELAGYSVKSVIAMQMGGPQCTTDDGQQISDSMFADATAAGLEAGAASAASAVGSAAVQTAAAEAGGGIAGSVAGSAAGAFTGKLASNIFGAFKKKKAEPAPEAAAAGGSVTLFRVTNETTSISAAPVAADVFDLPAGFAKVAHPLADGT